MSEMQETPSAKYITYFEEVKQQLAHNPSQAERERLESELSLLERAKFVTLNGIIHHYQDVGPHDGEPIVLIHGWDCFSFWWHHIVDPLTESGYRVILYDLKGHGFSGNDPQNEYTVTSFREELRALSQALKLDHYHIAAFSFGAVVALDYAAAYPDQVCSVVFFNFGLLSYNPVGRKILPPLMDIVFNRVLRPIERLGWWRLPYWYARMVLAKNTPHPNDVRLGTLSLRLCDPDAVRVSAQQLANPEVQEAIPRNIRLFPNPTLLVAGKGDPIMLPKNGRKLMEMAPKGTYREIQKCGHLILFELPNLVVEILRQHLQTAGCQQK